MSGRAISLVVGTIFVLLGLMNIAQAIIFKIRGKGFFWARNLYLEAEDDGHDPVGFQTVIWGNALVGVFAIVIGLSLVLAGH